MVMVDWQIRQALKYKRILCFPELDPAQIRNASVDVSLGRWAWIPETTQEVPTGLAVAESIFRKVDLTTFGGLRLSACGEQGMRALVHTHEFIGGAIGPGVEGSSPLRIVPEMRAKSTTARWGITVCACAGWGDVGYCSRWAMEFTNLNPFPVWIPLGALVAQIVFHEVAVPETAYNDPAASSSYQAAGMTFEQIVKNWRPEMLLPGPMKSRNLDFTIPGDRA